MNQDFKIGDIVTSSSGSFARVLEIKKGGIYVCTIWCKTPEEAMTTDKQVSMFNLKVAETLKIRVIVPKDKTATKPAKPETNKPATKPVGPAKVENDGGETAKYKLLKDIETTDEKGNVTGTLKTDTVEELPVELGDIYVKDGIAEKVEEK